MRSVVTRRLVLRSWSESDRAVWNQLHTDDAVLQFIGNASAPSPDTISDRFAELLGGDETNPARVFACEVMDTPGSPVGMVSLVPVDGEDDAADVWWRFLPEVWGNGYATEATRGLLSWSFEADDFTTVTARIQLADKRSVAIAGRLGLVAHRRTIDVPSERWIDVYRTTEKDWDG